MAEFQSARDVYHAAEKIRDAGYTDWDVHSPFPIHGLDGAMGLKKSSLSWFVFIGGATGTLTAFLLQFLTQVWLYPTYVQDKPASLSTLPAFFPVMFELTVLFSALTAVFGSMIANRLPRWNHPLFVSKQFERFSDDAFFICIEARDPKFSKDETKKMLNAMGGRSIELIEDEI
ncbi:MAG: DUF3341 domain-containing protein [Verrucomicrobiales bacterium]|nr:DUF3341 domain-containing protein [Verrucomicrobiales bacterium]